MARMGHRTFVVALVAALGAAAALWACKDSGGLAAGEECHGSSECGPGLVCDFGQTPPVCSGMLTNPPDADPNAPDAPPDQPDAPPAPDAPPGTPDADLTPDAPLPDAPLPDAPLPDAAVDAMM
jgi:hypothetical protein